MRILVIGTGAIGTLLGVMLKTAGNEVVFQYVMKWLSKQVVENGTVQNSRKMFRVA